MLIDRSTSVLVKFENNQVMSKRQRELFSFRLTELCIQWHCLIAVNNWSALDSTWILRWRRCWCARAYDSVRCTSKGYVQHWSRSFWSREKNQTQTTLHSIELCAFTRWKTHREVSRMGASCWISYCIWVVTRIPWNRQNLTLDSHSVSFVVPSSDRIDSR
jgi:hypothetical protein